MLRSCRRRNQTGFTFLWVLAAVAIMSIGLLAVTEVWTTSARRQRLAELDWIGLQFTQAIGSYYYATPAAGKKYPPTLQDLLQDPRYVAPRRHLREIYRDPFTGVADWELVTFPTGGIAGVRAKVPLGDESVVKEFIFSPDADSRSLLQ